MDNLDERTQEYYEGLLKKSREGPLTKEEHEILSKAPHDYSIPYNLMRGERLVEALGLNRRKKFNPRILKLRFGGSSYSTGTPDKKQLTY